MSSDSNKTYHVLYFKHVIENALDSFFSENEDGFSVIDGEISFVKPYSESKLKSIFRKKMASEIMKRTEGLDMMNPRYFFIIGACRPRENMLLENISRTKYFPEKIRGYIENDLKYFLKVNDVRINLKMFNSIFESVFEDFFRRRNFTRVFGNDRRNLFFIMEKTMDCHTMYRVFKHLFGKSNVCNMYEESKSSMKSNLYSTNEKIDEYIPGAKDVLKTMDSRDKIEEIREYISMCVNSTLRR